MLYNFCSNQNEFILKPKSLNLHDASASIPVCQHDVLVSVCAAAILMQQQKYPILIFIYLLKQCTARRKGGRSRKTQFEL